MKQMGRPFTLLEIVIVLALMGLIGGVAAFSLGDLLSKHRATAQIDELKELLQELQIEALALKSDMQVFFTLHKKTCSIRSKTAEKILRDRTVKLTGIQEISLNQQPTSKIDLTIISTGRFEPPGVIGIERKQGSLWIDVRQPLQIKFTEKEPPASREPIPPKVSKKGKHETH
ncbi:MAG: pilus assembly FimT family protein [Thermodesulfobacteriota bacterium]